MPDLSSSRVSLRLRSHSTKRWRKQADQLVLFFDGCRRKHNVIDYTGVQIATSTEAVELLQRAQEFSLVRWLSPELRPLIRT